MSVRRTEISILLILIFLTIFPAYGKNDYQLKEHLKFYLFWGNLSGLGFGGNYIVNDNFSLHLLAGAEPLIPVIWASPYSGNLINFNLKTEISIYSGLYMAPGYYFGLFNIQVDRPKISNYIWQSGPTFALGFKYPKNKTSRRIGLEFGAVFELPSTISVVNQTKLDKWIIEAERSSPSKGILFPSVTIMVEL